jgi:hypothetical protein
LKEKTNDALPMKKMKSLRTIIYKLRSYFETPTHPRTHTLTQKENENPWHWTMGPQGNAAMQ